MKGFILILSVVMNGNAEMGGAAVEVAPIVFETMADCQAAAKAFTDADGSWSNHRATCVGKGGTVTTFRM